MSRCRSFTLLKNPESGEKIVPFKSRLRSCSVYSTAERRPGDRLCPKLLEIMYINLALIKEQHECKTKLWELQVESIVWIYCQQCSDFIFLFLNRRSFDSKPQSGHQRFYVWILQWQRRKGNTEKYWKYNKFKNYEFLFCHWVNWLQCQTGGFYFSRTS